MDIGLLKTFPVPRFCSFNICIRDVSCGLGHAGFVTCKSILSSVYFLENNFLYMMGNNEHGQLGIEDYSKVKNSPTLVETLPSNRIK